MNHLLDGILFGAGFALINFPLELYLRWPKKRGPKKTPVLRLIKNVK